MTVALYRFIEESLQPAAIELLGSPIASMQGISTYSCRNRNGSNTDRLSEHALANALDVGTLKLANGKTVSVLKDWGPTVRDLQPTEDKELVAITGKTAPPPASRIASARDARAIKADWRTPPVPIKKSVALSAPSVPVAKAAASKSAQVQPPVPARVTQRPRKPAPPSKEQLFLKRVHREACKYFGTVLGPDANEAHRDHFHFDMAPRKRSNYCR